MIAKLPVRLFAVLAWLGQPAVAAETPPYPVWWAPKLELERIKDVEQRLQRDLWPDIGDGFDLYPNGDPSRPGVHAPTCDSLMSHSADGYEPLSGIDIKAQHYNLALCRAIALLGQARAAETSFLRDFSLNAEAADYLPALVNLYPSCEFICNAFAANRRGVALAEFDEVEHIEVLADGRILIATAGWIVELGILARGDITADGLDDVLLLAHGGATEGSYRATELFILTRDEQDGVLQVVDSERRLCPGYWCDDLDLEDAPKGHSAD